MSTERIVGSSVGTVPGECKVIPFGKAKTAGTEKASAMEAGLKRYLAMAQAGRLRGLTIVATTEDLKVAMDVIAEPS